MTAPRWVSLIVVSRGRPHALRRLMSALQFQTHPDFELIVVSDLPTLDGIPGADRARHRQFDEPNIARARNLGLAMARCDLVAFCDDDAVPDPWWLERLSAAFDAPRVGLAGGFVRGRNGIEYQWTATGVDRCGDDVPLEIDGMAPVICHPDGQIWPRVHGTNCAFRLQAIRDVGGFDEGFRFFLDETDLCLRLGQAGWATAIVPLAQVQHGFSESDRRSAARVPLTLHDIGASKSLFLSRHGAGVGASERSVSALRADRRAQLLRLMQAGRIEPRDVGRLMQTLDDGLLHGSISHAPGLPDRQDPAHPERYPASPTTGAIALAGTRLSARKMVNFAVKNRQKRLAVLMFRFSFTTLFHRRVYDDRGFWMQTGGLFGKSRRRGTLFRLETIRGRAVGELNDLKDVFPVGHLTVFYKFRKPVSSLPDSSTRGTEQPVRALRSGPENGR